MALTVNEIPDGLQYIGPSLQAKMIECTPSVSDYPNGGWPVTAEQCGFGNGHIYGATFLNQKYVASSSPLFDVNLPASAYGTNPSPSTTQINITAYLGSGTLYNNFPEAPTNTDFSGYPFWLLVYGY